MRGLNLGCGTRIHPDWENVDFTASAPCVRAHDLRKGIPYTDSSFDVVYHSHLLEHFSKQSAPAFLRECYRVLKPGGTIRIAVPDLERIARAYLEALENATQGQPGWAANYDWMVLELYDQVLRERSGGSWPAYFRQNPIPNWEFVHRRVGAEAKAVLDSVRTGSPQGLSTNWNYVLRNFGKVLRNKLAKILLGNEDYRALEIGRFRRQGEVHQWMYDAYSLSRLLKATGFSSPHRCGVSESLVPNWAQYCLDNERDGTTYRPDSMYMEAVKQ